MDDVISKYVKHSKARLEQLTMATHLASDHTIFVGVQVFEGSRSNCCMYLSQQSEKNKNVGTQQFNIP